MSAVTGNGLGTVVSAGDNFTITGGTTRGPNLFHSFSAFNIANPESATFDNGAAAAITNVIGRISGGASSIDGAVSFTGSSLSSANLFLINPGGIIFGENAAINIPGSFHASTADVINLGGDVFGAATTAGDIAGFSTSSPTSFGFLAGNTSALKTFRSDFTVGTDGTISLIGSSVDINASNFTANSGRINIASVDSSVAGASVSNLNSGTLTITGTRGDIILNNSTLDVSGLSTAMSADANGAGGDVYIIGGDLTLDTTVITSELFSDVTSGNIVLNGTGAVLLSNTDINTGHDQGLFTDDIIIPGFTIPGFPPFIPDIVIPGFTIPGVNIPAVVKGTGAAGDVFITGDTVKIENSSNIFSRTEDLGMAGTSRDSGSVSIFATNTTDVADFSTFTTTPLNADIIIDDSTIFSEAAGGGRSGDVNLKGSGGGNVDTLYILDSDISTIIGDSALSAGTIDINADNSLIRNSTLHSDTVGTGDAGIINIRGDNILIDTASALTSNVLTDNAMAADPMVTSITTGDTGDVDIDVSDFFRIDGSSISATTEEKSTGNAGFAHVTGGTVEVVNSTIKSDTSAGSGTPGQVWVRGINNGAGSTVTITNSTVSSNTNDGDAGNLDYVWLNTTGTGLVDGASKILSTTVGNGQAASVYIWDGDWTITGAGTVVSSSQLGTDAGVDGIDGNLDDQDLGDAGEINIGTNIGGSGGTNVDSLIVEMGAVISSDTRGDGGDTGTTASNAGAIYIESDGDVTIQSGAKVSSSSDNGIGDAGLIEIDTATAFTLTGANTEIRTNTSEGVGGNIDVTVGTTGDINAGGQIVSNTDGGGDAGEITLSSGAWEINGTTVASQVQSSQTGNGTGNAGNIEITVDKLKVDGEVKIDSSTSSSSTSSNAGSITITADDGVAVTDLASAGTTDADFILSATLVITGFTTIIIPGFPPFIPDTVINIPIYGSAVPIISSDSSSGMGNAGNITINTESAFVQGGQIFANTNAGLGGSVTVNADRLAGIRAQISANTNGTQKAGDISFNSFTAGPAIADWTLTDSNILSDALDNTSGGAGDISVDLDTLVLDNSVFSTSTGANSSGKAGDITIAAVTSIDSGNGSIIASRTGTGSTGGAGAVDLSSADINIDENSIITTSSDQGTGAAGDIDITAGTFVLDGASITSLTKDGLGGNITVDATTSGMVVNDDVSVAQTVISSSTSGNGTAGNILLTGADWTISGDANDAGDGSELAMSTVISSGQSNAGAATGDAGNIRIDVASVDIKDYAQITSDTQSASNLSNAGNISITATGDLDISSSSNVSSSADDGVGEAGSITLDANNLTLDGITLSTKTSNGAAGLGTINLNATTMGIITNGDTTVPQTIVQATTDGSGTAGTINITGGTWLIEGENVGADGSEGIISGGDTGSTIVSSGSTGSGGAGDVVIDVNALTITDYAQVSSDTINGLGGNVDLTVVTTGLISENAEVTANTTGTGRAGNVVLNGSAARQGDWTVNTNAVVSSNANTGANGTGNAGRVVVDSNTLRVNNATLSTGTADGTDVDAGLISIDVDTSVILENFAVVSSGIGVDGGAATATGSAGQITIITDSGGVTGADFVLITGGSTVTSGVDDGDITGTGNAGNISITSDTFTLSGAGSEVATNNINGTTPASISILANTDGFINTGGQVKANTSGNGDAGEVNIGTIGMGAGVGNWTILGSGGQNQIETSQTANGLGDAGDININVSKLTLSNSGKVASSTESTAVSGMNRSNAGNIDVIVNDGVAVDWTDDTTFENTADLVISGGIGGFYSVACNLGGSNCSPSGTPITGAAGSISITTESLFTRTADIVAYNEDGAGGAININADNALITAATYVRSDTLGTGTAGGISFNGMDGNPGGIWVSNSNLISSNSLTSATGNAGSIDINVDEFTMRGGSLGTSGVTAGNAGNIDITVSGTTNLNSNAQISSASNNGTGNAGSVFITSGIIAMNNADVTTATDAGTGGTITLTATDTMTASTITNGSTVNANTDGVADAGLVTLNGPDWDISGVGTKISSDANAGSGGGSAGGVDVNVTSLLVEGGAIISSSTESSGDAGTVTVVSDNITLQTLGEISSSANAVGTTGNAGAVDITTATLTMNNGVVRTANRDGNLAAGTITIDATTIANISNGSKIIANTVGTGDAGLVTLDGPDWNLTGAGTEVASNANVTSAGDAGAVNVNALSLLLQNSATISSNTLSSGDAGTVTVGMTTNVTDVTLQSGSAISSSSAMGTGSAGSVSIEAGDITINNASVRTVNNAGVDVANVTLNATNLNTGILTNGAIVTASTIGDGDAGSISLLGPNWIVSGATTQVTSSTSGNGDAGQITATTGNFLLDAATISTDSTSAGNSGAILIDSGLITLTNGGTIQSNVSGTGDGGVITLTSGSDIILTNGAEVSTNTTPNADPMILEGDAGNIFVNAVGSLNMVSSLLTSSTTSDGEAGTITINTGDSVYLLDSTILVDSTGATTPGVGGGNLNVTTGILVLDGSTLDASAGSGTGGNVSITADFFFISPDSVIDVSSGSGASGTLSVNAVAVDLSGSLNALKVKFKDGGKLLRQACSTKGAGSNSSSFIVENGIEGIPSAPDDFQSASTLDVNVAPTTGGAGFDSSSIGSGLGSTAGTALFASIACGAF